MVIPNIFRTFTKKKINQRDMDIKTKVRVVALPKAQYDKEWLDTLRDRAESDSLIWDTLDAFQEDLHLQGAGRNIVDLNWIYFLND